jgi:regulator of replication initiation timing
MDTAKLEIEVGKLIAEASKFNAEAGKLLAETTKLNAEAAKLQREHDWYPTIAVATLIGATVALTKIFLS